MAFGLLQIRLIVITRKIGIWETLETKRKINTRSLIKFYVSIFMARELNDINK